MRRLFVCCNVQPGAFNLTMLIWSLVSSNRLAACLCSVFCLSGSHVEHLHLPPNLNHARPTTSQTPSQNSDVSRQADINGPRCRCPYSRTSRDSEYRL
ncbi:hypothetical protein EV126DRAFT_433067 [Verticillium dahliae]|nr:hypothetical protein EV126DRAFT_433067 [Verticillium dahliae]